MSTKNMQDNMPNTQGYNAAPPVSLEPAGFDLKSYTLPLSYYAPLDD